MPAARDDRTRAGGALAGAFTHVVFKRLTAVEADTRRSNQHEFNASAALRQTFGLAQPQRMETDFVWMPDSGEFVTEKGILTWYDARARHPSRSEYRLYYRDNAVVARASAGDILLIGKRPDGRVLLLIAPGTGVAAERIAWLFGIEAIPGSGFAALSIAPDAAMMLGSRLDMELGDPAETGVWESEAEMAPVPHDAIVRERAREQQRGLNTALSGQELDWSPTPDEGLARTVEGVLRPR